MGDTEHHDGTHTPIIRQRRVIISEAKRRERVSDMPEPYDAVGSAGSPGAGSPCPLMWAGPTLPAASVPPITGWLTSGRFWGHAGTGSRARRVGSLLAPGSPQTAVSDTNGSSPRQVYTGLPSWRLAREGEERSAENRHPFAPHRLLLDLMSISPGVRSHGYRGFRLNNRVHLPNHFTALCRPAGHPVALCSSLSGSAFAQDLE